MNQQQIQDESDVWFRHRGERETMDAYIQSWMQQVDQSRADREKIGQPGQGERINWRQTLISALQMAPGMMVCDDRPNQTWRRIFDVKVVSDESQARLRSQGFCVDVGVIIVSLRECAHVLYFHPDAMVWALVPNIVKNGAKR